MQLTGNFHTHTTFCDGESTAEEMIERALALGFSSLGFSSHVDPPQGVPMDVPSYLAKIASLQETYRDRLTVLRGVELDNVMSPAAAPDVEYRIGSTHFIPPADHPAWERTLSVEEAAALSPDGDPSSSFSVHATDGDPSSPFTRQTPGSAPSSPLSGHAPDGDPPSPFTGQTPGGLLCIDYEPDKMHALCRAWYDGDYLAMAADYFRFESMVARRTKPAFVGHFDLVTRFNDLPASGGGAFLDEKDKRYLDAATGAMEQIIRDGVRFFEVNCGATNRGRKKEPYPSSLLLHRLRELDGELIVSSDAHHALLLDGGFPEALSLIRDCGFDHVNVLTRTETDTPAENTVQDIRFTDGREDVPLYWQRISLQTV